MKELYLAFYHALKLLYSLITILPPQLHHAFSWRRVSWVRTISIGFFSFFIMLFTQVVNGQSVVINKYRNTGAATDIIELLVVQDQADLRGLILKDFSSSNGSDGGGSRTFSNDPLWNGLRAGTLIVITIGSTAATDVSVSCTDFNLDIGGNNTTYFTVSASTFDLANNDMCMIKSGTVAGTADNIHTLRAGTAGTQWTNIVSGTRIGTTTQTSGAGTTADIVYVGNANSVIGDFNLGTTGALIGGSATISFGSGNNTSNTNFITFLRGPVSSAGNMITSAGFTANWGSLTGATSYRLDVSTSSTFASFVTGYNDLNVGNVSSYNVSGLNPNTTYYYRVRGVNATPTTSGNSCTQTVQTAVATPNLSINNVSLSEGNTGNTIFEFSVSLSSPAPTGGVTFDIATANNTATEPSDYTSNSLTSQTIPAGSSSYSFTVLVNGDTDVEPNETFFVNITNVTGATVTDGQGQGTIQNDDFITPTFEQLGPYCVDDTPDALPTTSTNGITGTWSPTTISTASNGTTTYTFTPDAGQGASTTTMDITVNPKPTLTLTAISASTANCGSMVSVQIGVNNTFEDINSLQFSVNWDPAQLEYVSNTALQIGGGDPILGTLDVASGDFIYTWIDPAGFDGEDLANTTVILTLNFKVKGTSGTASVNVTGSPTPMEVANSSFCIATPSADNFVMIGLLNNTALVGDAEVCAGSNITLTGTGTPAAVNPYVSSNTAVATINDSGVLSGLTAGTTTITYTNANGCTATREITVNDCTVCSASLTREPGTLCIGEEGVLTVNINNGFGNYTIAIDTDGNLATAEITDNNYEDGAEIFVYPTSTTTYTLISVTDNGNDDEICTLGDAVTINVTPITEPTFFSPGTFCEGAVPTILPTTSNNGITGTWNPSSINTSTPGTYTFVFTPDPGQCADTASVKARVVAKREPAFSVKTTYCEDDTPDALPGFSLGGDTGTWNPSSINTSTAGTFTYVFTPTPGACADTASIKVTVNAKVEPVFSEITLSYCEDETSEALPAESDNNIEGTWSPATVNTSTPGTTTYIFTPASGECADTASVKITINPKVKPTFSILSTYCQGQTPANLPTTSSNGVAGTWNPSTISTTTPGTITYVFTPDNAECTDTASVKVVVSQPVSVEAGTPQTICVNQTLDLSELNASITGGATSGTWSSSGTGSFTGGTAFGTATAYVPSTADKNAGTITLTLTSADPAGPCPAVVDTVVITIRNLNCSTFPWNGGK